jgi:DNA adenine methylase
MNELRRPILRYFGGKWMMAPWIISHFPKHRIYVEPYGGGASVLLRKERTFAEIYNDLDGEVVNVFRVMRERSEELAHLLMYTPFSRDEFNSAHEVSLDPIEQARRTIIRSFMGHGADSVTRNGKGGFRSNSNHENQGRNAANDWINYLPELDSFRERLSGVIIENRDALEVMSIQDSPDTLHFVDPPYVWESRTDSRHCYRHEMTNEDHIKLLKFLTELKGMVVLCGYHNSIYAELGWHLTMRSAYADGAKERTECLWMNEECFKRQNQLSFEVAT